MSWRNIKESNKPYDFISQKIKNEVVSKQKILEKHNPNWINESESGNTLSYSKVFGTSSREYAKMSPPNIKANLHISEEEGEMQDTRDIKSRKLYCLTIFIKYFIAKTKEENYTKIVNSYSGAENKFTSYNSPLKGTEEEDQLSPNSVNSNNDGIDVNANFDSNDASDISPDITRKNLFIQENIIHPEEGTGTLEEVKEFDEESESKGNTGRKGSKKCLNS